MARLISDGGSMTVGRRTASWTWGQFEVTLPEGESQGDPADDRFADGYIYRPDDRETGRFDLTFVRADARIDMNAQRSDLESTLDGASRRTEGSLFYSREITGKGLARTRPGIDYITGDVVEVLVWSRVMDLPVTAITALSTLADPAGSAVQVGEQMLRDAAALRKRNSALDAQIASEKKQRLKSVGEVRKTANTAKSTADKAQGDAEEALDAVNDADGAFQGRLEESRRLIEEGREQVQKVAGSVAESTRLVGDANRYAQEAIDAADQADQILATIEGDAEQVRAALLQVSALHEQVKQNVAKAQQAVSDGQDHVREADRQATIAKEHADLTVGYARDTRLLVDEAEQINQEISGLQQVINRLHGEAIQAASDAAAEAGVAAGHAGDAAREAGKAAGAALEAAGTNTESIGLLEEAQGLLQTAVSTNTESIGKLRDAQHLTNQGVRAAAAAAGQASAAAMQNSMAIQEVAKAAEYALEASEVLRETIREREKAQQIVDKQQFNTLLLHDNQLKWSKWTRQRYIYAFSEAAGETGNITSDTVSTGLIDARMNAVNGQGLEVTRRPGWAGNYKIEVSYTGGGDSNFQGRMGGRDTTATMELLAGDREIRWVAIWVWPEWSPEPREFIVRIDQNNDFAYDGEYDTWGTDSPIMNLGEGRIRFPTIDVTASVDVELFYGLQWITIPSGDIIGAGGYIRPVQDAEQRDTDLVTFTEFKGTLTWEPGAPQTGTQRMQVAQQTLSRHTWRTVASWTCPDWSAPVDASLKFELRFLEHNMISSNHYETRILLNGTQISSIQRNSLGGMNMYFAHDIDRQIKAGDRLEFQAQCGAGFSSERRVGGGEVLITW